MHRQEGPVKHQPPARQSRGPAQPSTAARGVGAVAAVVARAAERGRQLAGVRPAGRVGPGGPDVGAGAAGQRRQRRRRRSVTRARLQRPGGVLLVAACLGRRSCCGGGGGWPIGSRTERRIIVAGSISQGPGSDVVLHGSSNASTPPLTGNLHFYLQSCLALLQSTRLGCLGGWGGGGGGGGGNLKVYECS